MDNRHSTVFDFSFIYNHGVVVQLDLLCSTAILPMFTLGSSHSMQPITYNSNKILSSNIIRPLYAEGTSPKCNVSSVKILFNRKTCAILTDGYGSKV